MSEDEWFRCGLALIGLGIFHIGASYLIASFGWRRLAAYYPRTVSAGGQRHRFVSARVNRARYQSNLTVWVSDEGLVLSVLPIDLFHPPLFLPWKALAPVSVWTFPRVHLIIFEVVAGEKTVKLELPEKLFRGLDIDKLTSGKIEE